MVALFSPFIASRTLVIVVRIVRVVGLQGGVLENWSYKSETGPCHTTASMTPCAVPRLEEWPCAYRAKMSGARQCGMGGWCEIGAHNFGIMSRRTTYNVPSPQLCYRNEIRTVMLHLAACW